MIIKKVTRAYKQLGGKKTLQLVFQKLFNLNSIKTDSAKDCLPLFIEKKKHKELFIDVSEISAIDWGTGIQRVTKSLTRELLNIENLPYTITLVYASGDSRGYREATYVTDAYSGDIIISRPIGSGKLIKFTQGDVFFGLDWTPQVVRQYSHYFDCLSNNGVRVIFLLHDILPVTYPHFFPSDSYQKHIDWLQTICRYNGVIAVSKSSMEQLSNWIDTTSLKCRSDFFIKFNHNGADINPSESYVSKTITDAEICHFSRPIIRFLMVGTVEPRKGHKEVLDAFRLLWAKGASVKLTIVGKIGWNVEPLIEEIESVSKINSMLVYKRYVDDSYLVSLYNNSDCLIAASYDEGFGLPLIEAAQHRLSIIARDIPVFREVAGKYAFYFQYKDSERLAQDIEVWINLYKSRSHPSSEMMPWITWKQSAEQLAEYLIN